MRTKVAASHHVVEAGSELGASKVVGGVASEVAARGDEVDVFRGRDRPAHPEADGADLVSVRLDASQSCEARYPLIAIDE